MKRKGFTIWELVVVVGVVVIIAVVLIPVFSRPKESGGPVTCSSNLKQIALGLKQYIQDNNETYPAVSVEDVPTKNGTFGWADALDPYLKSTQIFQCPSESSGYKETNPLKTGYTDYYFNAQVGQAKEMKLDFPGRIILLGDGNDGSDTADARYAKRSLPPAWIVNKNSPAHRHKRDKKSGANYAFVDGHVKWYEPQDISVDAPSSGNPTFFLK